MASADASFAAQLTGAVQQKLIDVGWSTGGLDDEQLAEYILLMVDSGKTQEQIASELANDLLSLPPDDPSTTEFAKWLFQQVDMLKNPGAQGGQSQQGQSIPSFDGGAPDGGQGNQGDAMMNESMDGVQSDNIPRGPKSMRNNNNNMRGNNNRRMFGQVNRAMDRSNDQNLHRVRSQGSERINMHNRQGPKGRGGRFNSPGPGGPRGRGMGPGGMQMGNFPQQQQMQILQLFEQQKQLMSALLPPNQQHMLNMNPNMNPRGGHHGKSLFDRVNRQNGGQRQGGNAGEGKAGDVEMGEGAEGGKAGGELGPDTICKFNLKCTKPDCIFAHQSPVAPPGSSVDVNDHCPFGAACQNRKCGARHPPPAQKKSHQAEQDCKFFPNCTNPHCPFRHPQMPLCRNGGDCTTEGCKFTHVRTMCKYNPCLNGKCIYKHEEGQKQAPKTASDMVWTADKDGQHVSERKFVNVEGGPEELVKPEESQEGDGSGFSAEVAT